MKAADTDELTSEFNIETKEGYERNLEYERYRAKTFKMFDERQKKIIQTQHLRKPIDDFVTNQKQLGKAAA